MDFARRVLVTGDATLDDAKYLAACCISAWGIIKTQDDELRDLKANVHDQVRRASDLKVGDVVWRAGKALTVVGHMRDTGAPVLCESSRAADLKREIEVEYSEETIELIPKAMKFAIDLPTKDLPVRNAKEIPTDTKAPRSVMPVDRRTRPPLDLPPTYGRRVRLVGADVRFEPISEPQKGMNAPELLFWRSVVRSLVTGPRTVNDVCGGELEYREGQVSGHLDLL